jgi:hypothetical protein
MLGDELLAVGALQHEQRAGAVRVFQGNFDLIFVVSLIL